MDFSILKHAGVKQTELATMCGVSKIAVYKWSKGGGVDRRHVGKIQRLFRAIQKATEDGLLPISPDTPRCKRADAIKAVLVKQLREV